MFFVRGARCVIVALAADDARLNTGQATEWGVTAGSLRASAERGVIVLSAAGDIAIASRSLEALPDDAHLFVLFAPGTSFASGATDPGVALQAAWEIRKQRFDAVHQRSDEARASGDVESLAQAVSDRDALIAELADEVGGSVVPKLLLEFKRDEAEEIGPSVFLVDLTDGDNGDASEELPEGQEKDIEHRDENEDGGPPA
jgi:hypothetical protein